MEVKHDLMFWTKILNDGGPLDGSESLFFCCFSFGSNRAASTKFKMNSTLATRAGHFLPTFLYKKPPADGPTMKAKVDEAVSLSLVHQ